MSEGFQVAMEAQLALPEVALESGHKLTCKAIICASEQEFTLHRKAIPVFLVAKPPSLSSCDAEYYTSNCARNPTRLSQNSHSGSFPMTRHSLVLAAQSNDPATRSRAIEAIAAAYWRPVYKYVRMKWNIAPEDAADFTQEFFTRLLEKEFLDSYESSKGRLRTFLRTCADRLQAASTASSRTNNMASPGMASPRRRS
jgi:hypothetical protein